MDGLPPDINPEDYAQFVQNLQAYFEAMRAAERDGGIADDETGESPGPTIEKDLLSIFAGGIDKGLDADVVENLMEALRALAPDDSYTSLPGWAEFIARLFRYEQDFLYDLEEVDLPDAQRTALRKQMVTFFRGLARQLTGHLEQAGPPSFTDPGTLAEPPEASLRDNLLSAITDPACIVDSAGRIRYLNPAFRALVPGGVMLLSTPSGQWFHWEGQSDPRDRVRQGTLRLPPNTPLSVVVNCLGIGDDEEIWLLRPQRAETLTPPLASANLDEQPLRDENQRLRSIYRAWLSLGVASGEEELIPTFLRRLGEVVPWGAAAVLLTDSGQTQIWTSLSPDVAGEWEGLANRLTEHYELFAHHPTTGATLRSQHLGLAGHLEAPSFLPTTETVVLPLVAGDRVWGVLALYRADGQPYNSQAVQAIAILAHGLASIWRQLLTNRALQRTHDHIQQELRFAHRVQRNFLPQPSQHPRLRIVTRFVPAAMLSGDFYLFDQPTDGPVTILIGDVAGHGIPAALMMMAMVGIFTELLPHAREKFGELLPLANLACCQILEENYFVTAQALRIDPVEHTITISNAGHPPPLHLAGREHCAFVESSGLPLGMFPDAIYTVKHLPYHPGDRLICYTDGLIEVRDRTGRPFGKDRLRRTVTAQRDTPSTFLLDNLVEGAQQHGGRAQLPDDVALICVDLLEE